MPHTAIPPLTQTVLDQPTCSISRLRRPIEISASTYGRDFVDVGVWRLPPDQSPPWPSSTARPLAAIARKMCSTALWMDPGTAFRCAFSEAWGHLLAPTPCADAFLVTLVQAEAGFDEMTYDLLNELAGASSVVTAETQVGRAFAFYREVVRRLDGFLDRYWFPPTGTV